MAKQTKKNTASSNNTSEQQQIGANGNEDKDYMQQFNWRNKEDHAAGKNNKHGKKDDMSDQLPGGSKRGGGGE